MKHAIVRRLFITFALLCCCTQPAWAQDPGQERIGEYGDIDWVNMRVQAQGMGLASPNAQNMAHAHILAKGAAKVVAQRNLLEVVKGVHIDSETTVKNYMVQDDTIVTQIKGVLKGATIEKYIYEADGSCTAYISMPLTGDLSRVILQNVPHADPQPGMDIGVSGKIADLERRVMTLEQRINSLQQVKYKQEQLSGLFVQLVTLLAENQTTYAHPVGFTTSTSINELEANQKKILATLSLLSGRIANLENGKAPSSAPASQKTNQAGYTGLVIDARDIGFRPCLRPKIFGMSKLLYPGSYVDRHLAIRQGYVRFYRNLSQAQHASLVGKLPYTVKVSTTDTKFKRTLMLPTKAAQELASIIRTSGSFMSQCKVVVVF